MIQCHSQDRIHGFLPLKSFNIQQSWLDHGLQIPVDCMSLKKPRWFQSDAKYHNAELKYYILLRIIPTPQHQEINTTYR